MYFIIPLPYFFVGRTHYIKILLKLYIFMRPLLSPWHSESTNYPYPVLTIKQTNITPPSKRKIGHTDHQNNNNTQVKILQKIITTFSKALNTNKPNIYGPKFYQPNHSFFTKPNRTKLINTTINHPRMRAQRKTIKAPGILAEKTHAQCVASLLLGHSFHFGYLHPSSLPCLGVDERVSPIPFLLHQYSCVGVGCLHTIHVKFFTLVY